MLQSRIGLLSTILTAFTLAFVASHANADNLHVWTRKHDLFTVRLEYWDRQTVVHGKLVAKSTLYPQLAETAIGEILDLDVCTTRISKQTDGRIHIVFSSFPSTSSYFDIMRINDDGSETPLNGRVEGYRLQIPGDGFLYTSGHNDTMFDMKRKWQVDQDKVVEVTQPLYYVGLKTETLKALDMTLYSNGGPIVAPLKKGEFVEVLVSNDEHHFLVRNRFGLVGWVIVADTGQTAETFKGIYFHGD